MHRQIVALFLLCAGCETLGRIEQKELATSVASSGAGAAGAAGAGAAGAGAAGAGAAGAGGAAAGAGGAGEVSGAAGSAEKPGVRPPKRPPGVPTSEGGKTLTFAARRLRFGRTDVGGKSSVTAWRDIGFDIDGIDSTFDKLSAEPPAIRQCQRHPKAKVGALEDGNEGRDNVFGSNIFPLIDGLAGGAGGLENKVAADITKRTAPTLLFVLNDVGEGPDDSFVPVQSYMSSIVPGVGPAKWDGLDEFQVALFSVYQNALTLPKVVYTGGYLSGHTYVSNSIDQAGGVPPFFLPIGGDYEPLIFEMFSSVLVIELDEKHERAMRATFSGVALAQSVQGPFKLLADRYLCQYKEIYESLLPTLSYYADLSSKDPYFQDLTGTRPCDALSMAIEFELEPIAPITTINKNPSLTDFPCPP